MHISQGADLMRREALPQPTDYPLTSPPEAADVLDQLAKRQVETATCGWMQFGTIWEAWGCVSQTTCKTINNKYFGCFDTIYTTCLPSTICASAATVGDRDLCCERSSFIECITGYRLAGETELTGYRCAVPSVKGDLSVYDQTTIPSTSASTTSSATTGPSSSEPRTTTVTPTTSTSPTPDPGPGTPVGAIVGGVIGGVAVIALIGLAVFFIMRKKKNQQQPQPVPQQPPMDYQPQPPTPYQQQPVYQPVYPSGVPTSPPPPMSPPPGSTHGYQPTPDNSGYGAKGYNNAQSPAPVEMPIDNPRNDRAPVELQ